MDGFELTGRSPGDDILGSPEPDALGLGRYCDWQTGEIGRRLRWGGETGVHITGAMGTGKDTRLLQNMLLQSEDCSFFVVDPKMELAAVTAPFRRTLGPVHIINPYNILVDELPDLKSDGFNPLLGLDPDDPTFSTSCGYIADAVITAGKNDSGNAKHFINSSNNFASMEIQAEVIDAHTEKRTPTFANVRKGICEPSGYDFEKKKAYGIPVLAKKLAATNRPALANLAAQFTEWNNEVSGIVSEARQQTRNFDDAEIMADMAKGTLDFRDIKCRPTTVHLGLPPMQMGRQSPYTRIVLNAVFRAVLRPRKEGEPKIILILNEMATYGEMKMLTEVWGILRGYGVQIISVWQSDSQLEEIYGKANAATFISQAGVEVYLGAADMATAKRVAERCGNTTAVAAGYNNSTQPGNSGPSSGLNWGQVKIPTVTPHQILGLRDGHMVQFANGLADFVSAYAPPYWQIRQCRERARANPYYRPRKGA